MGSRFGEQRVIQRVVCKVCAQVVKVRKGGSVRACRAVGVGGKGRGKRIQAVKKLALVAACADR